MFVFSFSYQHIKYQLFNMLKMKREISQQDFKSLTCILWKPNIFYSLEVVERVCEHNFMWVNILIK